MISVNSALLLLLHLDDVMHIGTVKHLNVPIISTPYYTPTLIEKRSN